MLTPLLFIELLYITVFAVVAAWLLASIFTRVRRETTMPTVFASGTVLVTDATGEVIIDEVLPKNRDLLQNPELYIMVGFDPSEPPPPPCVGGVPDECDWELFFSHVHDTYFSHREKVEELKLKILWRVSGTRTIVWKIMQP